MEIAAGDPRRLDLEAILEAASAASGLREIGEPDILPGLKVLLDSLVNEAQLRPSGVEGLRASFVSLVCNRQRIQDIFQRHPELFKQQVRDPIVIIGLPRSGTTKMQRIVAANPELQTLPLWRVLNPAPIGPTPPGGEDPRIAYAEQVSAVMRDNFPDFYAGHPMNAREPEEEVWMGDLVMRAWSTCYTARIPTYQSWLGQQDFSIWYDYLRKLLQMFQWQDGARERRWLLKAPEHFPYMTEIFRVFPEATIVHCHRDPVTTVASLGALTAASRRMYSDSGTLEEGGRFALDHWAEQTRAYMKQRALVENQHRFVDVAYAEIMNDVVPAIERIYAAANMEMTPAVRARTLAWETENPPGKHGRHSYSLQSLGLEADEVRSAFAEYMERFGSLCRAA